MMRTIGLLLVFVVSPSLIAAEDWQPAKAPLMTRWAADVRPDNVHAEYPRPQLARDQWQNLNGLWQYAIRPRDQSRPDTFDGQILVPFAAESALSGVMKKVGPDNALWYRRSFTAPKLDEGERLRLHFGAVDWRAKVWVNRQSVGRHQGGYDPFSIDITDALKTDAQQEIVVRVWDPTNEGFQPRGKQVAEPRGIWYTSVTGIWQTVWLETVPAARIEELKMTPDVDGESVRLEATVHAPPGRCKLDFVVLDGDDQVATATTEFTVLPNANESTARVNLPLVDPKLWSPESPFLYDLTASLSCNGIEDEVTSYFGMRKIEMRKDVDGFNRMFLNGQPVFQFGPLDQGWWPDGLYTAPTDEALKYDIEVTKQLGFNMCRKHVKVEPARWYYWCDKLGLLVWQDMPNGDQHIGRDDPDMTRTEESAENFRREYQALIDAHYNHPSIVVWVPFNEGWGQFETDKVLAWTKSYDPSRLVDGPSGWTDRGTGDIHDIHSYPGPAMPEPEEQRIIVLGEFGGLGLPMEEHLWWNKRNWGYRTYKTLAELRSNYDLLIDKLQPMISRGLAAAVYTQTTDVEGEVNGLMTYDRHVIKFDPEHMRQLHQRLYEPPPIISVRTLAATSEKEPRQWKYTTQKPSEDWMEPGFDDSQWSSGEGGFGERSTPGSVVRTEWKSSDIWLRRQFELAGTLPDSVHLRVHHDEDAVIYINGKQVASLEGYVSSYTNIELKGEARQALQSGQNTIAVHCRQTSGGQYIDVGLVHVQITPRSE